MNWDEHNLVRNDDILHVAAWQEFDWLKQGFSLRSAGNVGSRFGDITEAKNTITQTLGVSSEQWTGMQQVHGNRIQVVDSGSDFAETDGMITNKKGILLAVVVADCVPLLLVDPVKRVIGVAHAGRRGTEQSICKAIVNQMVHYGSKVEDLQVAIGPSIGPCCYEINPETHEHYNLWETNEQQMREIGVETIIRTNICTKDHNDLFFSHRADEQPGRFAGLMGIS